MEGLLFCLRTFFTVVILFVVLGTVKLLFSISRQKKEFLARKAKVEAMLEVLDYGSQDQLIQAICALGIWSQEKRNQIFLEKLLENGSDGYLVNNQHLAFFVASLVHWDPGLASAIVAQLGNRLTKEFLELVSDKHATAARELESAKSALLLAKDKDQQERLTREAEVKNRERLTEGMKALGVDKKDLLNP